MCLITIKKEPYIAKEDIICYKVIYEDNISWVSVYQNKRYPYGLSNAEGDNSIHRIWGIQIPAWTVSSGYFHAFINLEDAQSFTINADIIPSVPPPYLPLVIVKCIIPKNSYYFKSKDKSEICSDKIIILKENIL